MFLVRKLTLGMKFFVFSFAGMFFGFLAVLFFEWFITLVFPLFGCQVDDLGNNYYCQTKDREIVYTPDLNHDLDRWDCSIVTPNSIIPNVLEVAYDNRYIILSSVSQPDNKIVYWIVDKKADKKIIGEWNVTDKAIVVGWEDTVSKYKKYSNIYGPLSKGDFSKKREELQIKLGLPNHKVSVESQQQWPKKQKKQEIGVRW